MAKKLGDKLMNFFGFEVEEVEEDEMIREEEPETFLKTKTVRNNVVNLHTNQNIKIVVVNAEKFEQVQDFATELKNRRPVVVNFENIDKDTARRILDFMSGATYALGGLMRKISSYIFLFAPSNVDIDGNIPGEGLEEEFFSVREESRF